MVEAARFAAGPKVRQWATQNGFSEWMVARFHRVAEEAGLDAGARLRFLDGLKRKPPQYVRANALRTDPRGLQLRLEARGFRLEPCSMDPAVFRIHHAPISQGATMEHLLGWSSPQDLSSTAAPLALGAQPGETIADLAAAPGMKTIHVAGDMKDEGALVACEPDKERFRALSMNLERSGASCTVLRRHTAQELPGTAWADRVMVDAPCTGEGTIPKDRTRRRGRPEETGILAALQEDILDAADRVLKPGGVLVYATCTFAPEENEGQVQRLLDRGYTMESTGLEQCEGEKLGHGITQWPGLELSKDLHLARRFFPGVHPTLGFFVARLRKGAA